MVWCERWRASARASFEFVNSLLRRREFALQLFQFGALDEGVQTLTPGRTGADITDWIADVIGAAAGAALSLATVGRLERLVAGR